MASAAVPVTPRRPMSYRISRAILYGVLILFALYVLVPFVWVIFTALKSNFEIAQDPLGLPPNWRFENIVTAWNVGQVRPLLHQQRDCDRANYHSGGQHVLSGRLRLGEA